MSKETQTENTTRYEQQLLKLNHLIETKNALIIISGITGSGKSQLLEKIRSQLESSHQTVHCRATDQIKPNALLKKIYALTDLKTPDIKLRFEEQLQAILHHINNQNQTILLTIDDAHLLNYSVLAAVSHLALLQESKKIRLQVILTGQPPLSDKMKSLQTRPIPELQLSLIEAEVTQHQLKKILPEQTSLSQQSIQILKSLLAPTRPINSTTAEPSSTLKLFWIHHQVKTVSFSAIILLTGSLWYFNDNQKTHRFIQNKIAYSAPRTTLVAIRSATPTLAANHSHPQSQPYYSIQLISGTNKQAVQRFIRSHQLTTTAWVSNQNQQYEAMTGHFNSFQKAAQSIQAMSKDIKKYHPWIRRLHA